MRRTTSEGQWEIGWDGLLWNQQRPCFLMAGRLGAWVVPGVRCLSPAATAVVPLPRGTSVASLRLIFTPPPCLCPQGGAEEAVCGEGAGGAAGGQEAAARRLSGRALAPAAVSRRRASSVWNMFL